MDLLIQKYGGSSVATLDHIRAVANNVASHYRAKQSIVCVVSAMGNQTDELTSLAYEISDTPPQRELDMLLTAGERISMTLLSIALNHVSIPTVSLTGSQCGIITDSCHGNARIKRITGEK